MHGINSISRGKALVPNRRKSLPWTVRTSRQRSRNQGLVICYVVGWLWLWSMRWVLDKRKVCGLIPSCSQNGYRAQVPKHPIHSYRYLSNTHIYFLYNRISYLKNPFLLLKTFWILIKELNITRMIMTNNVNKKEYNSREYLNLVDDTTSHVFIYYFKLG